MSIRVCSKRVAGALALSIAGLASAQPASIDLGDLNVPGSLSQTFSLASGQVRWVRFNLTSPISVGQLSWLDIDTNGSSITGNDTEIGLYDSNGARLAFDDEDGILSLSAMTFGLGSFLDQNGPDAGGASNGRDGGYLPTGTYYLAVGGFDTVFNPMGWSVTTTSTRSGTLRVNLTAGVETPIAPPSGHTDLGLIPDGMTTHSQLLAPSQILWYRIQIPAASTFGRTFLDIDTSHTSINFSNDTEIGIYAANGRGLFNPATSTQALFDDDDGPSALSALTFGSGSGLDQNGADPGGTSNGRDGNLGPGVYFLAVAGFNATFGLTGFSVTTTGTQSGTVTINLLQGSLGPPMPPPFTDLGLDPNVSGVTASLNSNEVKWFRIELSQPVSAANGRFLDIDTIGSSIGSGNNTQVGFFDSTGFRLATDDDDGPELLSALSFGKGYGAPTLDGLAFDGRDGSLAAGVYYLAVSGFSTAYGTSEFSVTSSSTMVGQIAVNVRTGLRPAPVPPSAIDLGEIHVQRQGTRVDDAPLGLGQVLWYKFTTRTPATAANLHFMDIHTGGSMLNSPPIDANDTLIALYNSAGILIAADDDDWSDAQSAITFGRTAPRPGPLDADPNDGRDGPLPAGTYYLAVGGFNMTAYPDGWAVYPRSTYTGTIDVTFLTDLPLICVADVDDGSGMGVPDGGVTVEDLLYYLGIFDMGDLGADVDDGTFTGLPDGGVTIDDLLFFLFRFDAGC